MLVGTAALQKARSSDDDPTPLCPVINDKLLLEEKQVLIQMSEGCRMKQEDIKQMVTGIKFSQCSFKARESWNRVARKTVKSRRLKNLYSRSIK